MILSIKKFYTISHISSLSIFVPLIAGGVNFKRINTEQRTVFWYVVVAAATELISIVFSNRKMNNLPVFHVFTVLELALLVYFYYGAFKRIGVKINAILIIALFAAFAVINAIFFENIYSFNTYASTLESLILILLSGYYLYSLLTKAKVLHITDYPNFWGSAAILFYFSGTLFLFASSRLFMENWREDHQALWSIHAFFNIGFNLLLAKTLWSRQVE